MPTMPAMTHTAWFRWLKDGRISMASTEGHALVEAILRQQLVMEASVIKTSDNVSTLADTVR